jgi:hypothetical protein
MNPAIVPTAARSTSTLTMTTTAIGRMIAAMTTATDITTTRAAARARPGGKVKVEMAVK